MPHSLPPRPEPSTNRRRLLKAAATSAPLMATLPSGAALANASAFHCLVGMQGEAGGVANEVIELDGFIRVPARRREYTDPVGGDTFVRYVVSSSDHGGSGELILDSNGESYTSLEDSLPENAEFIRQFNVYLLRVFGTTGTANDPPVELLGDGGCTGNGSSPNQCFWPIARQDSAQPGNIPLAGSCYCSIYPGDTDVC